jgi:hypothetical protein
MRLRTRRGLAELPCGLRRQTDRSGPDSLNPLESPETYEAIPSSAFPYDPRMATSSRGVHIDGPELRLSDTHTRHL